MSVSTARREVLPFLSAMTYHCKPEVLTEMIASWLELDAGEVSYLTGSGKDTKKVARIVESAKIGSTGVPDPEVREVEETTPPSEVDEESGSQAGLGDFG